MLDPCPSCGTDKSGIFMVWDHVWAAAGLKFNDGWWCWDCFEKKLGRKLVLQDLTAARCNALFPEVREHLGYEATDPEFNNYFIEMWKREEHP